MVQDIKITPSGAGDKIPQMLFTGSGATAENMELTVRPDSRLSYEGTEGEVFSISNNLQAGTIFAVKDISGLDQISINASGDTYLAPYYGNVRVGATGVIHEDYALDVQGKGLRVGGSGTVLTRASAPSVTTDTLYNVGGDLYFDGSTVGGGSAAGAIHQIQYNDGSGFAGDSQFLFSKANAAFTNDRVMVVSGTIIANSGDANYISPVTIGSGAHVTSDYSIAIGRLAKSVGASQQAIAIGQNAQAQGFAVAIGGESKATTHSYSVAIGYLADANNEQAVAIGKSSRAENAGVSIGQGTYGENYCVVIGQGAYSTVSASVAIGLDAKTLGGTEAVALGVGAEARAERATAVGPRTVAGTHGVALGNKAVAPDGGFVLASGSALTDVLLSGVMKTHLTMPNGQQFRQMATAAQTTDLMQWQNSAGVNVAAMTPSGVLNVNRIVVSGVNHGILIRAQNAGWYNDENTFWSVNKNFGWSNGGSKAWTLKPVFASNNDRLEFESWPSVSMSISMSSNREFSINTAKWSVPVRIAGSVDDNLIYACGASNKVGIGTDNPQYKLDVMGHGAVVRGSGVVVGNSGIVLANTSAPAVTANTLYNNGGTLSWAGSPVGGGSAAGSDAQVQYNDGGSSFGGDVGFTYYKDKAGFQNDRTLVVSGVIIANSGDANYKNSITIGSGVYQINPDGGTTEENIIIGTQAWAKNAHNNIIIGKQAYARSDNSNSSQYNVIIGYGANVRDYHAYNNVVIGRDSYVGSRGDENVVIGYGAKSGTEHESNSVYIGRSAGNTSYNDGGTSVVCVGGSTGTHGPGAVAVGTEARAQGEHAISIGVNAGGNFAGNYSSSSPRYGAINLGAYTHADGPMSIAIGHRVVAPTKHFVLGSGSAQTSVMLSGVFGSYLALPNGQQFRQIASAAQTSDLTQWQNSAGTNVASMTPSGILNAYDIRTSGTEVVLGQDATSTQSEGVAIGHQAENQSARGVAIGYNTSTFNTSNVNYAGVAIGSNATTTDGNSVSIGNSATAPAEGVAIGGSARAGGFSVAIGKGSYTGHGGETRASLAIGYLSSAYGKGAVAVGGHDPNGTKAVGFGSLALGYGAEAGNANSDRSVAIGCEAKAYGTAWVIASGDTSAEVGISGVFGSYVAIPNDQQLAVGSNVPQYAIDVVQHGGVIRASGIKGHIRTNADASTVTFDLNTATTHAVTLGGDRTLAVSNANVGDKFLIRLQQPTSSAGKTVTWFSHIKWAGGTAPTLTATANKADLLGFLAASGDGGSNIWYDGFVVGQNI